MYLFFFEAVSGANDSIDSRQLGQ